MKKVIFLLLITVVVSVVGCADKPEDKPPINVPTDSSQSNETPDVGVTTESNPSNQEAEPDFIKLSESGEDFRFSENSVKYDWLQSFGDNDYFIKSSFSSNDSTDEYLLINRDTQKEIDVSLPEWNVASGTNVVLKNRYQYEWLSRDTGNGVFKSALVRLDGETGEVEIVDTLDLSIPFIYVNKIDNESFVSNYSITVINENKGYIDTETVISVYNADGTNKEIIRENCRNFYNGGDSEGLLLQNVCSMDGKIYSYGWQTVGGEKIVYLYTFSTDGKLENKEELTDELKNVLLNESLARFNVINDYIMLVTWNCDFYIFKKSDLIMQGDNGSTVFAFSESLSQSKDVEYICFVEREIDGKFPKFAALQAIELSSGEIKNIPIKPNEDFPYMSDFMMASNGDLVFKYQKSDGESSEAISGKLYAEYLLTASNLSKLLKTT